MRSSLAIIVALVLSWMLILPAFAASDSNVPVCCRKSGKHKCAMLQTRETGTKAGFSRVSQKCPYAPISIAAAQHDSCAPPAQQAIFAGIAQHPAVSAQTEAGYRISFSRSRQKRGPPSLLLS